MKKKNAEDMAKSFARTHGLDAIADEARYWVGLLLAGEPTDNDRAAFEVWLRQSPRHRSEFEKAERVWTALGASDRIAEWVKDIEQAVLHLPEPPRFKAYWLKMTGGFALVAAIALMLIIGSGFVERLIDPAIETVDVEPVQYVTGIAEMRTVMLEDDTALTLGGASSVEVRYTDNVRQTSLLKGSVYYNVTKDAKRPLTVEVAGSRIGVLGTAFGVRLGADQVDVSVSEGVVTIGKTKEVDVAGVYASEPVTKIVAGRKVSADLSGNITYEGKTNLQTDLSWVEGYLTYTEAPLSEVIADINRYRVKQVALLDAELKDLQVTVSFRTDQIDQFLVGLPVAYPVVVREDAGRTMIRTQRNKSE